MKVVLVHEGYGPKTEVLIADGMKKKQAIEFRKRTRRAWNNFEEPDLVIEIRNDDDSIMEEDK